MKITFLGTGTSTGIPTIGVDRESCFSDDPRDNRCLLYTSPSPRDAHESRMPSSA